MDNNTFRNDTILSIILSINPLNVVARRPQTTSRSVLQAQLVSKATIKTAKCHVEEAAASVAEPACSHDGMPVRSSASHCAAVANDSTSMSASPADAHAAASCSPEAVGRASGSRGAKCSAAQASALDMTTDTANKAALESVAADTVELGEFQCVEKCVAEVCEQSCTSSTAGSEDAKGATPLQCAGSVADACCQGLPSDSETVSLDGCNAALLQVPPGNGVSKLKMNMKHKGMTSSGHIDRHALDL